jgi:small subunit ribosomal protein S4
MKIGPKYKIAKRLGANVFDKTQTQKFMLSEARSAKSRRRRFGSKTEYARQLLEKQKVRFTYYVSERQFKNYVKKAMDKGGANPAETLFALLEARLDNTIYRMGLAPTRQAARQMVAHGHIVVNGRRVTVPSFSVSKGDAITIRLGSKGSLLFTILPEKLKEFKSPSWVLFDTEKMEGTVVALPKYEAGTSHFDLAPVLEFYSR